MKKRLLSLFCALSLLLTLLPTGVFAVEAGNEEATAQAGDTGAVKANAHHGVSGRRGSPRAV